MRNYPGRKQRIHEKHERIKAQKRFPKKEFGEYWYKHSDDVCEAVYDSLLNTLAQDRILVDSHSPNGRSRKVELNKGNVGHFCTALPDKLNGSILRELLPDLPKVNRVILVCDNVDLVEFCMSTHEKVAAKLIMNYIRQTKKYYRIVDYVKDHINEIVIYDQLRHNKR